MDSVSNHVDNDGLDQMHQSRLSAKDSLRRVQDEIAKGGLETDLKELQRQEEALKQQIKEYDTAFARPNRLPVEILRDIFKHSVYNVTMPPKDNGNVYTISRVCSVWRRVALATPELWSTISLSLGSDEPASEQKMEIAQEWLSRAGQVPLSVKLELNSVAPHELDRDVVRKLLRNFRFRRLSLTLDRNRVQQLKRILHRSAAVLEELKIYIIGVQRYGSSRAHPIFYPNDKFPSLTSLFLRGPWDESVLIPPVIVPWERLLTLSILMSSIPVSSCFNILLQCRFMKFCHLEIAESSLDANFHKQQILLPELQTLRLSVIGPSAKQLVDALNVRKLEDLMLYCANADEKLQLNTSDICDMIRRSDGMLELKKLELSWTENPLDPGAILACAPPFLYGIEIENGILDEETLSRLATGELGHRLRNLRFAVPHDADKIIRTIEARNRLAATNNGLSPFRHVYINCPTDRASEAEKDTLAARCETLMESLEGLKEINLLF